MKHIFMLSFLLVFHLVAFSQKGESIDTVFTAVDDKYYGTEVDLVSRNKGDTAFYRFNSYHPAGKNTAGHVNIVGSKATLISAPNTDLSFLFSGAYGDLVKNSASIDFTQPNATANVTFKLLGRNAKLGYRNYDEIIRVNYKQLKDYHKSLGKTLIGVSEKKMKNVGMADNYRISKQNQINRYWWRNSILAMQAKFDGGTNNNVASLLSGAKPNTKVGGQIGLVWILPGIYHYNEADFKKLAADLRAARVKQQNAEDILRNLLGEIKTCDNCDNLLFDKTKIEALVNSIKKDLADANQAQQDKDVKALIDFVSGTKTCDKCRAAQVKYEGILDSVSAKLAAVTKLNQSKSYPEMDKIFDSYKPVRRTFQWINLSGQLAYNNNIGYFIDTLKRYGTDTSSYLTGGVSISYNLMHASDRACENVFFGVKGSFLISDNTGTASTIKLKTTDSTFTTTGGGLITKPGTTYDAYANSDLTKTFVFDLNTTLIYFFDKNRIFGITESTDLIAKMGKPVNLNMHLGLNFSIPQSAGRGQSNSKSTTGAGKSDTGNSTKAVVTIAPYLGMTSLLTTTTKDNLYNNKKFSFKNHYAFGLNTDIPFSIFGL